MRKAIILKLIFSLLSIFAAVSFSSAQTAYTPAKNSKEWKDIIAVLKVKIDEDGEKKSVLSAAFFRVKGNWAYLRGLPKKNATVEEYNYNVKALLKKSDGKWNVVKYLVGSDDFASMDWWKEFKAPKAIFP